MGHLGTFRRVGSTGLLAILVTLSMVLLGSAVSPASAASRPGKLHVDAKHVRVTAPVSGETASGRPVRAVFIPKSFTTSGGVMKARGVLKGRILKPGPDRKFTKRGVSMRVVSVDGHRAPVAGARQAAFPPTPSAGACNVLNLVLAPLDLNVLGLQVHLDQVVLNIVAQSGAGQLLGNLLCFVAGLLDGGGLLSGLLTQVTALLNRILGALGGLSA